MNPGTNSPSLVNTAGAEWCHSTVGSVSRTFELSINLLEEPMSTSLCVGYLICRVADTIEDEPTLTPEEKLQLLSEYNSVLDPSDSATVDEFVRSVDATADAPANDDWFLVADSQHVLQTYKELPSGARDAITPPAVELVDGMRTFVKRYEDDEGIRIQTEAELEEYCYYVAGVIGRLITDLQLWNSHLIGSHERMRELSESCGQLLQTVNIAKDVYIDYTDENNIYLPQTWLEEVGVSQAEIVADANKEPVVTVIERLTERARRYLDDGQAWLEGLPAQEEAILTSCAVPFLLAVATLRELSERPEDALSEEGVKISRKEVMSIVASVTHDFNKSSLGPLRESIRRGELK